MSHQVNIHDAQISILRELLFVPEARFADLQKPTGLESDHFKFHVKRLVELGYVEKRSPGCYGLTVQGKEHANKLDTDTNTMEKQPKLSVVLLVKRQNAQGETEYLCQQRLKNPYFGFWGRVSGKVGWGESIEATAARELEEETGLTGTFEFKLLYRKRDFNQDTKALLEDKCFLVMQATEYAGELMEDFEGGHNAWLTQAALLAKDKLFSSAVEFVDLVEQGVPYFKKDFYYQENDY